MTGRRRWLAAGLAGLVLSAAAFGVERLRLEASRDGRVYVVDAEVRIDAPIAAVRAVITDYEHLTRLSNRIEESRVLEREPNSTLVATRLRACFAFFCRTIERVERVIAFGPHHIEANTLPGRSNVRYGKSVWMLHDDGDATRLEYYLALEPDFWVPPLLGSLAVRRSMRDEAAVMFERIEDLAAGAVVER